MPTFENPAADADEVQTGTELPLPAGVPVVVGRSAQVADWAIANECISGAHAVFEAKPGTRDWEITVYDRGSTNGTTVNGAPLEARIPRRISDGAVIELGPKVRLAVDLHG